MTISDMLAEAEGRIIERRATLAQREAASGRSDFADIGALLQARYDEGVARAELRAELRWRDALARAQALSAGSEGEGAP